MVNLLKNKGDRGKKGLGQDIGSHHTVLILNIVTHLGVSEGMLERLSLESGILPNQLRHEIMNPEVQAGIVDFLLNNEPELLQFCEAYRVLPAEVWKMRLKLPGAPVSY